MNTKETRKLKAEELEKRVAPATLYVDDGSGSGKSEQTPSKKTYTVDPKA